MSDYSTAVSSATSAQTTTTSGFRGFMNPESALINSVFDGKFKSYLNPLCTYTKNPNEDVWDKVATWVDPGMKTIDANIKGEKDHFTNLNPIYTTFLSDDADFGDKARSWVDPGMACATSFIKNEKAAKIVYTLLNPIGGLITNTLDIFS